MVTFSITKVNKWAWGKFHNISHTSVINTVAKGPSISLSLSLSLYIYIYTHTYTHIYICMYCNIRVCIQKQIAYKIKSIILSFHSQVFIHTLLTPLPHPLPLVFKRSVGVMVNYFVLLIFLHSSQFLDFSPSHQPIGHPSTRTAQSLSKASYKIAIV